MAARSAALKASLTNDPTEHIGFVAEPNNGEPEFIPEFIEGLAHQVAQLYVLELASDAKLVARCLP